MISPNAETGAKPKISVPPGATIRTVSKAEVQKNVARREQLGKALATQQVNLS